VLGSQPTPLSDLRRKLLEVLDVKLIEQQIAVQGFHNDLRGSPVAIIEVPPAYLASVGANFQSTEPTVDKIAESLSRVVFGAGCSACEQIVFSVEPSV
jgi:hypothetical protein